MTIAYSNKYDLWTTRYSFEPTCYARTGNTMLSSKENGLWKHDVNENRCRFYDVDGGASIDVFSNQDPSAIKAFNALSIETNINSWTASVYTNEEYTTGERQEGQVDSFDNREGFKYAEMPRSVINSTGNISPLPKLYWDYYLQQENEALGVTAADTITHPFVQLDEYILINLIAENQFPVVIGSRVKMLDEDGDLVDVDWNKATNQSASQISELGQKFDTEEGAYIYSTGVNGAGFFRVTIAVRKGEFYDNVSGAVGVNGISQHLRNNQVGQALNTIIDAFFQGFTIASQTESGYGPQFGFNPFLIDSIGSFDNVASLSPFSYLSGGSYSYNSSFSSSPSVLNGDQMRGPYARVKLETQTTEPLELHAINVDYSFSKLDSRLNQNS